MQDYGNVYPGMHVATPGQSLFMDALDAMPGLAQTAAISAHRGSNTILGGGRRKFFGAPKDNLVGGFLQNVGRPFSRYTTQDVFFPKTKSSYTPFGGGQFANQIMRRPEGDGFALGGAARLSASAKISGMSDARFSRMVRSSSQLSVDQMAGFDLKSQRFAGARARAGDVAGRARMGVGLTVSDLRNMGSAVTDSVMAGRDMTKQAFRSNKTPYGEAYRARRESTKKNRVTRSQVRGEDAFSFISKSGASVDEIIATGTKGFGGAKGLTAQKNATAFAVGAQGHFGGFSAAAKAGLVGDEGAKAAARIMGHLNGLPETGIPFRPGEGAVVSNATSRGYQRAAKYASDLGLNQGYTARQALSSGVRSAAGRGAGKGATLATRGKLLGKSASLAAGKAAPLLSRFAGPIGVALTVYDVAKFGVKTAGRTVNAAFAAVKSFTGDSFAQPFSTNFRDNEVSATSRQRGVAAIQNSRLNARSILGNEAAAMARHFG